MAFPETVSLLVSLLFLFCLALEASSEVPPGPYVRLKPKDFQSARSFSSKEPLVGTYFFYWYDIDSKEHFINPDGSDALTDHPANVEDYSYKSPRWWYKELQDVMSAGIDFILPVYWGTPGYLRRKKSIFDWSFEGLPPLVSAWKTLKAQGKIPPQVGLFYDTSTLRHNDEGYHADLSTDQGKQWFYETIRDFFSMLPSEMWAMIDKKPIVVLYSPAFAKKQDAQLFPYVKRRFREDFSCEPYIIKHIGWEGLADAEYSWGAALQPKLSFSVAALGPGYDHSAVPGRQPLVVPREEGRFYQRAWEQLLQMPKEKRPKMVLIETWNELHEGTEICETKEYGRQYLEMTAHYSALWKKRD